MSTDPRLYVSTDPRLVLTCQPAPASRGERPAAGPGSGKNWSRISTCQPDAHPVLISDALGGGYVTGTTFRLDLQWPAATGAWFFFGVEQTPAIDLGPIGLLRLSPAFELGNTVAGAAQIATLGVTIPKRDGLFTPEAVSLNR